MSAQEVIDQIKHLPPSERVQVVHFLVANETPETAGKATPAMGDDGLPILRTDGGAITCRLVRELENLAR